MCKPVIEREMLELKYDLAYRERDPVGMREAICDLAEQERSKDGLLGMIQRGEVTLEPPPVCKYCRGTLDFEPFMNARKRMPQEIHHRMSFGVKYDEEGKPYHEFVWQCIFIHQG